MSYIGFLGVTDGDYRVILNPMDYDGNICGTDSRGEDMTHYPYLYPMNQYGAGVCVKKCPSVESPYVSFFATIGADGFHDNGKSKQGWQAGEQSRDRERIQPALHHSNPPHSTPPYTPTLSLARSAGDSVPDSVFNSGDISPIYAANPAVVCDGLACADWAGDYVNEGQGYGMYVADTSAYMKRCIVSSEAFTAIEDQYIEATAPDQESSSTFMSNLYGDFYTAKAWILGFGFGVSMVISFVYSFLLRVPGILFGLVWTCVLSTLGIVGYAAYYAYTEFELWNTEDPKTHTSGEISGMRGAAIALAVITFLWFVTICFLRKRIQLSIELVKQAARAVAAMPVIVLFPIFQCCGYILFLGVFIVYAVNIASMGDIQEGHYCIISNAITASPSKDVCEAATGFWYEYRDFTYDDQTTKIGWYLIFAYFWTSEFIVAIGQIVVAMAVAKWYFTRDKTTIGNATVWSSIRATFRYHTGTAAFGSLIIAIIKLVRAMIAYAQKKAKASGNKIAQAVLCMLQCYMWCMEKCMKFLNKNAYIQTAIFGTNFCSSAKNAFFLILRNVARIGACSLVSEFVMIIGKAFICAVTAGIAYFALDKMIGDELNSPIGPVLFIVLLSWCTASMFMNIFAMAISTVLQCFVADEEMFSAKERYAEGHLVDFVNTNGALKEDEKTKV